MMPPVRSSTFSTLMRRVKRRKLGWIVAATGVVGLLATGSLWGSYLGRQIPWLQVSRVEITGTRLLAPHEVLAASGIRQGQHLLDDVTVWESALLAHPVIAGVEISRKPPQTLRILVSEKQPVALLSDGTLKLATAAGEILPVEPYVVPIDLPIIHGSLDDSVRLESTREALAEIDRLTLMAPTLMREISEVRVAGEGPGVLLLNHSAADILIPIGAGSTRIEELRRILSDLDARFPRAEDDTPRRSRHRVDLRFEGQVVVLPSYTGEHS
jgi:cell division septal protein FtsQ